MKKKLLLITSLLISHQTLGAANINYLNIDGNILYFSTSEAKTVSSPTCVAAASNNRWAVSLDTQQGQSVYVMLLTAITNNISVEVTASGDCNGVGGLERPKSVALKS